MNAGSDCPREFPQASCQRRLNESEGGMNRKRKVLTIIGLLVLAVIVWAHVENHDHVRLTTLLVPGLFYAGLYAILGGPDKPRNWRRIIKITSLILIALLAISGSVGAIIYIREQEAARQRQIESAQRKQAAKIEQEKREQAKRLEEEAKRTEEEASKHRIKPSEIDLTDLRVEHSKPSQKEIDDPFSNPFYVPQTSYFLHGHIRNRSAHRLNSIKLRVQFYEREGSPDILGDRIVWIPVDVPPRQTREITHPINFRRSPHLTEYAWKYDITEIRGGEKWPGKQFDADAFLDSP